MFSTRTRRKNGERLAAAIHLMTDFVAQSGSRTGPPGQGNRGSGPGECGRARMLSMRWLTAQPGSATRFTRPWCGSARQCTGISGDPSRPTRAFPSPEELLGPAGECQRHHAETGGRHKRTGAAGRAALRIGVAASLTPWGSRKHGRTEHPIAIHRSPEGGAEWSARLESPDLMWTSRPADVRCLRGMLECPPCACPSAFRQTNSESHRRLRSTASEPTQRSLVTLCPIRRCRFVEQVGTINTRGHHHGHRRSTRVGSPSTGFSASRAGRLSTDSTRNRARPSAR